MDDDELRVLSPRHNENQWVPSCFGGFGCVEATMANDYTIDVKTTRSAPILILKGIGTMTMGRLGEKNNNLRDDIATWKQRIADSLYIGVITYTTRSNLPDELDHLNRDTMFVSRGESKKPWVVVVDDIEERSVYEVEDSLTQENGARAGLLQLLSVLEDRDFSGALRLVNDFLIEHHTTIEKKQAPTLEDTLTTSFAMHNKAVLEMVNGIFKYAVNYFKEAADIKEALLGKKHTSVIETMEQLAVAMYGMEAYDQCHSTLRSIHSRCNSRAFEARTWNAIAVVHFQKGEHDFAFECARHATIKYEESEWSATIALANLGYIQLSRGEAEGKATLESAEEDLAEWLHPKNEIVQSIRYNMNMRT